MRKDSLIMVMLVLMTLMGLAGCSDHENDDVVYDEKNPIVGRWVLYEVNYAFSAPLAIEKRIDFYVFTKDNSLRVTRNNKDGLFLLEGGDYQYTFDSVERRIMINNQVYNCVFFDKDRMSIGCPSAYDDRVISYGFKRLE